MSRIQNIYYKNSYKTIMSIEHFVKNRVKKYYWEYNINCATTILKILSEHFQIILSNDLINAATGMHGAGKFGAQCGLVEGTLMFIGVFGKQRGFSDSSIAFLCNQFAGKFEKQFGSLQCNELRPQGFSTDNPPHLCETITCKGANFSIQFVQEFLCE